MFWRTAAVISAHVGGDTCPSCYGKWGQGTKNREHERNDRAVTSVVVLKYKDSCWEWFEDLLIIKCMNVNLDLLWINMHGLNFKLNLCGWEWLIKTLWKLKMTSACLHIYCYVCTITKFGCIYILEECVYINSYIF